MADFFDAESQRLDRGSARGFAAMLGRHDRTTKFNIYW